MSSTPHDTPPLVIDGHEMTGPPDYDEGGVFPPGVTMYHNGGAHIPILTAEQVDRGLAWLRDHYRDGKLQCPASPANPDA